MGARAGPKVRGGADSGPGEQSQNDLMRRRRLGPPWRRRPWRTAGAVFVLLVLLTLGAMYGTARWYQHTQRNRPLTLGVTFIPDYARYLHEDPQAVMDALTGDLHVRNFRLVSYWNDVEPGPGRYDFSQLDWEFARINAVHGRIDLSIGLRQPRWPECHAPRWIHTAAAESRWYPQLKTFMAAVVGRYRHDPALRSYQLENEYFNTFGECPDRDRGRLANEYNLVKRLDPRHPVVLSRSNNYGLPVRQPLPDVFGISVYRRVWASWAGRYVEYPFPSWYYAFLAGAQQILRGRPSIIHELQAEPWPPSGRSIVDTSLAEQNKSFNAGILRQNIDFARATGIRTIDLWGAEYWYYRKQVLHDASVWEVARNELSRR